MLCLSTQKSRQARIASAQGLPTIGLPAITGGLNVYGPGGVPFYQTNFPASGPPNFPIDYSSGCLFGAPPNCAAAQLVATYSNSEAAVVSSGSAPAGSILGMNGGVAYQYIVQNANPLAPPAVLDFTGSGYVTVTSDVTVNPTMNPVNALVIAQTTTSIPSGGYPTTTYSFGACASTGGACVGGPVLTSSFSYTSTTPYQFMAPVGELETMDITATGTAKNAGGSWYAAIDPSITLDPSNGPGYSILYSPDAAPVPLPASVWLMLSGLGGLALTGRRRVTPPL
jgi:hypothetical protein